MDDKIFDQIQQVDLKNNGELLHRLRDERYCRALPMGTD